MSEEVLLHRQGRRWAVEVEREAGMYVKIMIKIA